MVGWQGVKGIYGWYRVRGEVGLGQVGGQGKGSLGVVGGLGVRISEWVERV